MSSGSNGTSSRTAILNQVATGFPPNIERRTVLIGALYRHLGSNIADWSVHRRLHRLHQRPGCTRERNSANPSGTLRQCGLPEGEFSRRLGLKLRLRPLWRRPNPRLPQRQPSPAERPPVAVPRISAGRTLHYDHAAQDVRPVALFDATGTGTNSAREREWLEFGPCFTTSARISTTRAITNAYTSSGTVNEVRPR